MDVNKLNSNINNIYALTGKINQIYELVEESEGIIEEDQLKSLEINKEEVLSIGTDIFSLNNIITGQVSMIDKEIRRLSDLKNNKLKQQESIEKALFYLLLNFGKQDKKEIWRLDLGIVMLSSRKGKESIEITNEAEVPNNFKKFTLTLKDLTYEQLEFLKDAILNSDKIKEELSKINQETITIDKIKEDQSISKTLLKPKLEEIEEIIQSLAQDVIDNKMTEEEFKVKKESLPSYGAKIKEANLSLSIK